MPDLTYCPDARLEPDEHPDQDKINRLYYMKEALKNIRSFLNDPDYTDYFADEIRLFLCEISEKYNKEVNA